MDTSTKKWWNLKYMMSCRAMSLNRYLFFLERVRKKIGVRLTVLNKFLFKNLFNIVEQQENIMYVIAKESIKLRLKLKKIQNTPINVLFVCHEPALWSMYDSIYRAMSEDSRFLPKIITLPYKHDGTLPTGEYKDAGIDTFFEERDITVIRGYNKESQKWIKPNELEPDYLFFQTPYNLFPSAWTVNQVSLIANVCYVPYGTGLFKGEVECCSHPPDFFKFVTLIFKENVSAKEEILKIFSPYDWFDEKKVIISGFPKLDGLVKKMYSSGTSKIWKKGLSKKVKRILWTPRWRTSEGTCHFFDYKDFFINFCNMHQKKVDFAFRPHPLFFQNFIKTGEMTYKEIQNMNAKYGNMLNMAIDRTGDYQETFLSSDILVSDISSLLIEYLATGKPIVYTHRVNTFNDTGNAISAGFYWVHNEKELETVLEMLISDRDPLQNIRKNLIKSVLCAKEESNAGKIIKEAICNDAGY